jgi:hypothetical protein
VASFTAKRLSLVEQLEMNDMNKTTSRQPPGVPALSLD